MLVFSKIKSFVRLLVATLLLPVLAAIGVAGLLGISSSEQALSARIASVIMGLIFCFLTLVAVCNMLFGLGGLFGRRILLEIQGEDIIFYNHNPRTLKLEAIGLLMNQIKSLSLGDIDVLEEIVDQEDKQLGQLTDLSLKLASKFSQAAVSTSRLESICIVFFTDVLADYSIWKNNIWYNHQTRTLDIQTNFCSKKASQQFIVQAGHAIAQLYSDKL